MESLARQGPPGVAGPTGPRGPAGKVEEITGKTVSMIIKRHGRKVHVKQQKCHGRLISGPVKFKVTGAITRAMISRGPVAYATGEAVSSVRGTTTLILTARHPLRRGRYTLTIRARHGRRTRVTPITIA